MKNLFEENVLNKNPKFYIILSFPGELAQLARASALQAEGQGFEPPILHLILTVPAFRIFFCLIRPNKVAG